MRTRIGKIPQVLQRCNKQGGFSLIEMMVVILVLSVIMGAVFLSINQAQKVSTSEQGKLDNTQQAREFIDQITSDLRNSGYPYKRNMSNGTVDPLSPNAAPQNVFNSAFDPYNAPGLIYVDNGSLWFTGNVNGVTGNQAGTANVEIIRYDYAATGTNCPCLRRTEFTRAGGDPLVDAQTIPAGAPPQLEIQGVQGGNTAADAIFAVYDTAGNRVTLPIDIDTAAGTIAGINSITVTMSVQSPNKDYTGAFPVSTVISTISLWNQCSEALVNGQNPKFCQ
ncbi:MAG TPA: type II secretion system protein [Terriglobales bacterium]|jgi:prepilin-type N-terminal cleavage/methylation domain-containing protein|nr:type II secretion system protein [Terriglobales bacterium]